MSNIIHFGMICAGIAIGSATIGVAVGQQPSPPGGAITDTVKPVQPGGLLADQLGVYRTIEGIRAEGAKIETGTLLVDTVDGKKLENPKPLVIRGAVIVDHNLQPATLNLPPPSQRCILKGFESGEMIGVPPAISKAAQEQRWKEVPMSPARWQWRPYFVALVVSEPKDLELRKR